MYLPNGLTEKQEKFCNEYIKNGFNGTKAAIDAGYSKDTAYSIANENLNKPEIKSRIEELKGDIFEILDEKLIINEIWKVYKTAQKEADKLKALELFGRYKAMFTEKQQIQTKTFDDFILEQAEVETNKPKKSEPFALENEEASPSETKKVRQES